MLSICVVNKKKKPNILDAPRGGKKTSHWITDDAEACVKVVRPSIHVLSPLPPQSRKPNSLNETTSIAVATVSIQ